MPDCPKCGCKAVEFSEWFYCGACGLQFRNFRAPLKVEGEELSPQAKAVQHAVRAMQEND